MCIGLCTECFWIHRRFRRDEFSDIVEMVIYNFETIEEELKDYCIYNILYSILCVSHLIIYTPYTPY